MNSGYAHEAPGDYAKAIEWFAKAADQGRPSALIGLARCYEAAGDKVRACEQYEKYLAADIDASYQKLAETKAAELCR